MSDYWKDNGIEKPQAIVVCAACKYCNLILCGARHFDAVMRKQLEVINLRGKDGDFKTLKGTDFEQGFINQFGEFLTREEAMVTVKASGQPFNAERNGGHVSLFSEGLY